MGSRVTIHKQTNFIGIADLMRKKYEPFWISALFFRWWTIYLSALFVKLRLSANFITGVSAVSITVGSALILSQSPSHWVWAAGLLFFYYVLDHCDGEMARYYARSQQNEATAEGPFWDGVAHGFEVVPIGCLAFKLYQDGLGTWPLVLALITFTRFAVAPWQRYCEVMIEWGKKVSTSKDPIRMEIPLWAAASADEPPDEEDPSSKKPWGRWIRQAVTFPGYWLSLPALLVLDAVAGPMPTPFLKTDLNVAWSTLWLLQITFGRSLGGAKNTFLYARQLREMKG